MINIPKEDGCTPLHIAVLNGLEDITSLLLGFREGAEVNIEDRTKSQQTALHVAALEGFLYIVKLLLQHGAILDAESREGNTAIHLCVMKHLMLCNLPQQLQGCELYPDIATVRY